MYLDRRLWAFTRGVRARIAGTVLLGLLAVGAGIARLCQACVAYRFRHTSLAQ